MANLLAGPASGPLSFSLTRTTKGAGGTSGSQRSFKITRRLEQAITLGPRSFLLTRRMRSSLQTAYATPDPTLGQVWPRGNPTPPVEK